MRGWPKDLPVREKGGGKRTQTMILKALKKKLLLVNKKKQIPNTREDTHDWQAYCAEYKKLDTQKLVFYDSIYVSSFLKR